MSDKTHDTPDVTFDRLDRETDRPQTEDLRGKAAATRDRSAHRRHHWLYEDLLN